MGLAERVQAYFIDRQLTLVSAESCTGGLIGHTLTEVSGSSAYYLGGVVSYSNAVKVSGLGVSDKTLAEYGAVSAEVATEMATGVLARLAADVSVAVTGIAGPGGGSAEKPVGLTWVAAALADGTVVTEKHVWSGGRSSNKVESARAAIRLVLDTVHGRA